MVFFFQYPNAAFNSGDPNLIFLKVNYTLLLSGDIELNPGPRTTKENKSDQGSATYIDFIDMTNYQVSKAVLGSFNQANIDLFGQTAGTQCSTNSLYAIFWSHFRRVSIWKTT
eukprot:TCONS_00032909-protein